MDVEEKGSGFYLRIHLICGIVAGSIDPAGYVDCCSLVLEGGEMLFFDDRL